MTNTMKLVTVFMLTLLIGCNPSETNSASVDASPDVAAIVGENFLPFDGELSMAAPPEPYIDARSLEDKQALACTSPTGQWRCPKIPQHKASVFAMSSASQPIIPSAWLVSAWFFGLGGSDINDCITVNTACATFQEIEYHRLGTPTPQLQQPTTFTLLSGGQITDAGTTGQDWIFFEPYVANGSGAKIIGQFGDGGSFEAGVIVAKAADAGQRLLIGNMSGVTTGQLLFNNNRTSYAWVDTFSDAGFAFVSQPIPASVINTPGIPTLGEDNTWAQGDVLTVENIPKVNLKKWRPKGGDLASTGAASFGWMQNLEINDTSTTGNSAFPITASGVVAATNCKIDPRANMATEFGRGQGGYAINDYFASVNQNVIFSGPFEVYGGISVGAFGVDSAIPVFDGDVILHGFLTSFAAETFLTKVYNDNVANGFTINSGTMKIQGPGATVYGPATWSIIGPNATVNDNATFVSTVFTTGSMTYNGRTTGCFISGLDAGTVTCNVIVNPTNIDAHTALFDENSGGRYSQQ